MLRLTMTDHFYIHIPFCRQRCPYCKFALTPVFDEFKKKRYIEYLKKEIREYYSDSSCHVEVWDILLWENEQDFSAPLSFRSKWRKQKTIYFGWGTPSVLSHEEILEILEYFPFYNQGKQSKISRRPQTQDSVEMTGTHGLPIEITMEMNPEDVTPEYIEWVLALGINRISLGIQTLNETSLREIHRSDRETIFGALESIGLCIYPPPEKGESEGVTQKGIHNNVTHPNLSFASLAAKSADSQTFSGKEWNKKYEISLNIDFILGLPFVKPGETLAGIKELHQKFPYTTHTSVYMLEDEAYPRHWKANSITEDEMQSEFLAIMDYLESTWWHHYELSNFAKPWYESVHNQGYWDHSETRGFGLSAASYEHWNRWSNSSSFTGYYGWKRDNEEQLTPADIEIEQMMFGMRRDGWDARTSFAKEVLKYEAEDLVYEKSGSKIPPAPLYKRGSKLDTLISDWLLEIHENRIKPTKTWIFLLDHILSELISNS
jgi:oxygen-independent coproporphyrinogen III oxidase